MPRASTYAKNLEKYKRKIKADRLVAQFARYGFHIPTPFLEIGSKYDVVDYANEIMAMMKTKTLSKALKIVCTRMEEKRFYTCNESSFVPLSIYEKYFSQMFMVFSTWDIGRLRVNEWLPILKIAYPRRAGFSVYINPIDKEGVDVLVNKDAMPYAVMEFTNYAAHTYISFGDVERYRDNLNAWNKYNVHKIVVVSFARNLKNNKKSDLWEEFPRNGIGIKVMGHQA